MDIRDILAHVDHTNLKPDATTDEIIATCDEALKCCVASVCIPPRFVADAKNYLNGRVRITTVIGFPNGYNTTFVKVFETTDAVRAGADEIDVVANIGMIKDHDWDSIIAELHCIRDACMGKTLKVIIETALLTDEEKIEMCKIVNKCRVDYIKTSTGFAKGGATPEDVALLKANVAPNVKVKAAGGISSIEEAENYLKLGADRLGTSKIVKIALAQGLI